ncbi:MAG TPA: FAD-dependent monooxygenase, partial [Acidimicrobiia bacterium]|nr:FAD-dependent monooxygenase [Acidimicrobiia bacterium]
MGPRLGSNPRGIAGPGRQAAHPSRHIEDQPEFRHPALALHREDLQRLLLERASKAAEIRLGVTVQGIRWDASGVTAVLADGNEVRADILVGADGVDSVVRRRLFSGAPSRYAGFSAWRAVVHADEAELDLPGETIGKGKLFGFVPIGPQRIYWYA